LFSANFPCIEQVEIEKESVLISVWNSNNEYQVIELTEMEHSSKIKSLIEDKMFEEAHTIASGDSFNM